MGSAALFASPKTAPSRQPADFWTRRRDLFSSMVGEGFRPSKSACRIANAIEEDLIVQGWQIGDIRGSEHELARRFGVCRVVVREAVRILEARGTARMRRGPNGGLLVQKPEKHHVLGMAIRYARSLGCTAPQIADARRLLAAVRRSVEEATVRSGANRAAEAANWAAGHVLPLFDIIVEAAEAAIAPCAVGQSIRSRLRTRATHVAHRIMEDHNGAQWQEGFKLGAELDLCERYSVDRCVLRQAVRILESEGAVVSRAGRGHGLLLTRPGPGAICRLAQCYFASCDLTPAAVYSLFGHVSSAAVAFAAQRATAADASRMAMALEAFSNATTASEQADLIFDVEESQFATLDNPLIDLFLRSAKAFPCWNGSAGLDRQPDKTIYLELTSAVMSAIARNDPQAATAAQYEKFLRMDPGCRDGENKSRD